MLSQKRTHFRENFLGNENFRKNCRENENFHKNFRENENVCENFRENETFRENFRETKFSPFAKMEKTVFMSTLLLCVIRFTLAQCYSIFSAA
jgi:hypothetical protein